MPIKILLTLIINQEQMIFFALGDLMYLTSLNKYRPFLQLDS